MRTSLLISFFLLLFTVFGFPIFSSNSQVVQNIIQNTDKKTTYELPHPGILPDHPLYFIKASRDRLLEFSTRDPVNKVELYLLLSDKRTRMAQTLAQKGKIKLAETTLSKSEKYFLRIPPLVIDAKEQGNKLSNEFIDKLRMSNLKHYQVIESLIKQAPQGEIEQLQKVLKLNQKVKEELNKL